MTPQDLKQIAILIDTKLDGQTGKLNSRFDKQDEKLDAKLDEQAKKLNIRLFNWKSEITDDIDAKMFKWKSEIIDTVDKLAKEIRNESEFREIASHQIKENRERTDRLEKKVFGVVVG